MKRLALTITGIAMLAAAAQGAEGDVERLEAARDRWEAAGIADYRYAYRKHCECYRGLPPETVVVVRSRRIERVFHRHEDTGTEVPAREGSLDLYWTIAGLFDKLAGAYAGGAIVRVEYDERLGYPRSLFIDYDPDFTGFETDLREIRVERSR